MLFPYRSCPLNSYNVRYLTLATILIYMLFVSRYKDIAFLLMILALFMFSSNDNRSLILLKKNIDIAQLTEFEHYEQAEKRKIEYQDIFKLLPLNTQKAYTQDMRHFNAWRDENNVEHLSPYLDSNKAILKQYFDRLISGREARATIERRKSCLSKSLAILAWPDPFKLDGIFKDWYRLSLNKKTAFQNQAEAMTVEYLTELNDSLNDDSPLELRNKIMINIMFDCLLRASEACNIQVNHISYKHKTLFIPRSKTDQAGQGSYRPLSQTSITLIKLWRSNYSINDGFLLRSLSPNKSVRKVGIQYKTIYDTFKKLSVFVDLDDGHFSGHSARVGGAVTLASNGCHGAEIQRAGGWKSPVMVARYTEQVDAHHTGMGKISKQLGR